MVDLDIINGTIAEWEAKELTFVVVERLAWLYVVRDHIVMNKADVEEASTMPAPAISSGSEFMEACVNADVKALWTTLDELMDTIKALQPRLYDAVLKKLRDI